MARMAFAVVVFHLIIGLGSAVTLRRSATDITNIEATNANRTGIPFSAFSASFIADVDARFDNQFGTSSTSGRASLLSIKVAPNSGSLMSLAGRGAEKVDVEKALKAMSSPPPSVVKMLRQGYKTAAGANMWKADVDPKVVEKAIVNLNGMVFEAQKRLDAKNDECEEFKVKYTETLDQINSDLARLGQELSNIARAISTHQGGIEANILNNQKAKEELRAEETAYLNVRNADSIVLQERQTNLAVSAFILVFSACPDAPSASSMLQANRSATVNRLTSNIQKCVNSSGVVEIHFQHEKIESAAQRLSDEAQQMLLRFIEHEESVKADTKMLQAANRLESAALGEVEVMTEDLDDGDVDPPSETDDEADEKAQEQEEEQAGDEGSFLQTKQDPCGPPRERVATPDDKPCSKMPASCCSCNRYYTGGYGHGNDQQGWCTYVPSRRKCQSGKWLKRNPHIAAEAVCGLKEVQPPIEAPPREEQQASNRCTNAKWDCGIIHDMFAALWGETKDLVDELTYKMNQDTAAWDKVKGDINTLLQIQSTQMSNLQAALAESTAMKAAVTDEQAGKQKEKKDTTHLFDSTMKECQDAMKEILYMEICGVLAVRNNIISKNLPGEPTPTDCSVGEFVASDCSVSCDDELQGGMHALRREVMVMNSKRGVACPALATTRKCKQIPCPINCQLSSWSGWNKCSKECGGGVQSATRSTVVRAANGGQACDAFSKTQPCNTESCDIDCELGQWMEFKPCNKACNLGYAERRKRMISDAKGDGFCLEWNDKERLERKPCNAHSCTGDETCNSTIDLVIAIDSSGSITEAGFDILKEFAAKLVRRMMAPVQVGVVLFGNGKLDFKTRVISNAKVITDNLEGDMEGVASKIEGMVVHKGFTNMAQAFTKSKDVLTYARKGAQATVMVITDGRPSFKFQTGFAVQSLRKSARVMIVHVQANRKEDIAEMLKGYASEPWSINYRHIPGKKKLASSYDSYATSVLADLCPKLVSPSAITECTDLTGAGKSNAYPCECGQAMCKQDEHCFAEDHYCVSEKLVLLQGRHKNTTK
jgi:hypothetical protein